MKNAILVIMAILSLTGPANATSDWDVFWGTTVSQAFDPKLNGWDKFFGTTLDPQNTGWDDFWYQCQDENKTVGDCIGTVAAGIGLAAASPFVILTGLNAISWIGITATGNWASSTTYSIPAVVAST